MDHLPNDPFMLLSTINMLLRDKEYENLEDLCIAFDKDSNEIKERLFDFGFVYSENQRQFRPNGYDQ